MLHKKIIFLSSVAILNANEFELPKISVESTIISEVSKNAQVSADLAQALSSSVPSIDMNRRSGIANDIYIRGQKRDNISVEVDATKVYGACVNRMDPPISHIITSQIDEVEVIEGPYDVETFGTLSGGVKVTTKQPTKDFHGELNLGYGSWDYKKIGVTASGGNDIIRLLVSASSESSEQYEDGNGDTIAQQIDKAILAGTAAAGNALQAKHHDMDAYDKKSVMLKTFITVTDNQELRLSYTANRSDDILYGNSQMDAAYDDSNIYSVGYDIKNLSDMYKNLNIQYYYSDVDHPMDTKFRVAGATNYMTNHLNTSMQGLKLKNSFEIDSYRLIVGLDGSRRMWEGEKYATNVATGVITPMGVSLTHTETENRALFAKVKKSIDNFDLSFGARYDSTEITPDAGQSRKYNAMSANLLTSYNIDKENKIFLGFGQASRVPDARELYMVMPQGGNANLNQTTNKEIDLGYEATTDMFGFKVKTFYSILKDYIYYNSTTGVNGQFENVDAKVYGAELSASYFATDAITVDMGASYKRGKKDSALTGQTDTDLADMAPLRGNIAVNYEYMANSMATLEVQASESWKHIDIDNDEQKLASWAVLNMKVKHSVNKNIDFTLGVNNLFDKTYIVNNTSADLVLLSAGSKTMLMNEFGRYIYTNLTVKF